MCVEVLVGRSTAARIYFSAIIVPRSSKRNNHKSVLSSVIAQLRLACAAPAVSFGSVFGVSGMDGVTWSTAAGRSAVDVLDLAAPAKWTPFPGLDELDGWWTFLSMPQNIHLTAYGKGRTCELPANTRGPGGHTADTPPAADHRRVYDGPAEPVRAAGFGDGVRLYTAVDGRYADASPSPSTVTTAGRSRRKRFQKSVGYFCRSVWCCGRPR